jgi:primosomal protein N' (replication factor Y) (superfamily II helicase)
MSFAEVSVNSPAAQRKAFSYGIPSGLDLKIGQAVWVPFGARTLQGIVLELTEYPSVAETREISGLIDSSPLLSPVQVSLAQWISTYYLAPLFQSVALMLPPGFERRVITFINSSVDSSVALESLSDDQKEIVERVISQKGRINLKELEKSYGSRRVARVVAQLVDRNLLEKQYELEKLRVKPKLVSYTRLRVGPDEALSALGNLNTRASKQIALFKYFITNPQPIALSRLRQETEFSAQAFKILVEKGLVDIQNVRQDRDPLAARDVNLSFPLPLTATQESVLKTICAGLEKQAGTSKSPDAFLLRGVTGSGKTEIYLRALDEVVRRGKRGIVLVPEISMTPQIIERFVSRFPGRVAVMHSELTLGEQFDEWWRIKNGEFDVVIGPRSALFAPQPDLGLIILDEEHEWTYKQQDVSPRYHTREVALKLASLTGAALVLGSATPDVESYFKALSGEYHLLEMPERVTPEEGSPLPQVEIVDLRAELKAGNLSLFSRSLFKSVESASKNHEQIILFLNRRGSASFVECRNCGWVVRCKRCDVPLSYHFAEEMLVCHQCNYHIKVPLVCPQCGSYKIKFLGAGTEKLEQETARMFPGARILRWDSDSLRGKGLSHEKIFARFKAGEADILIGTQMIAKGLDLPGVTLVGVVSSDVALNLPDFRAGERTFQLLSQVAGRAGRGSAGGKVIIQTYSPGHYAIQSAAHHDYPGFYEKEIAYRRELRNPPFSRLARLVYSNTSDLRAQEEVEKMKKILLQEKDAKGIANLSLIGPAPAYLHRLRKMYRWQLILRTSDPSVFLSGISFPRGWSIDIDPVGVV